MGKFNVQNSSRHMYASVMARKSGYESKFYKYVFFHIFPIMLKTFYIKTFGCQMNYADSEKIHMILLSSGLRKVIDPTKADIIILNTCSVRQKGEDRVFGFIQEIKRHYKKAGTDRLPLFGITGCMVRKSGLARKYLLDAEGNLAEKFTRTNTTKITLLDSSEGLWNYDDELFIRSSDIDFVFRIEEISMLTKILSLITRQELGNDAKFNEYLAVKQLQENPASANVIIQTGCDNFCTFCIVPHTRGREVSRSQEDILDEIREVVKNGTKEVTLLGQNVNSYGKETRAKLWNAEALTWNSVDVETPFRSLLEAIDQIEGIDRIRFTSSNPHDMTKDILDAHFDLKHLCPYLHFALQSGSNTMLKRMNRKHTYEDFRMQVEYLRSHDPLFAISTDIIVGFPGETEEEFQATVRAMEECQFDFAYIARYSSRNGTVATRLYDDDISHMEKARRWDVLNTVLRASVQARSQMMIGRKEKILISGKGKDETLVGRTRNFKEVYIPYRDDIAVGDIVDVEIRELDGWVLLGNVL